MGGANRRKVLEKITDDTKPRFTTSIKSLRSLLFVSFLSPSLPLSLSGFSTAYTRSFRGSWLNSSVIPVAGEIPEEMLRKDSGTTTKFERGFRPKASTSSPCFDDSPHIVYLFIFSFISFRLRRSLPRIRNSRVFLDVLPSTKMQRVWKSSKVLYRTLKSCKRTNRVCVERRKFMISWWPSVPRLERFWPFVTREDSFFYFFMYFLGASRHVDLQSRRSDESPRGFWPCLGILVVGNSIGRTPKRRMPNIPEVIRETLKCVEQKIKNRWWKKLRKKEIFCIRVWDYVTRNINVLAI